VRLVLLTVGRIRSPHAEADAHYRKLLSRYADLEVVEARDEVALLKKIPGSGHVVALDRSGSPLDSEAWSRWLSDRRLAAQDVHLLIGGPHGLPAEAVERADEVISLGPMTLPHQLARVVLAEQLYRAAKILAGEPYHY
jgi:23S rRNA (pseudouridine1915-N3)-methyltransferase